MGSQLERFLQETGGVRKPTPGGPTTLTGQFLDDEDEKRRLRAAALLDKTEPETAARILNMEARTGLPHDLIERNLDKVEAAANLPGFDAEAFKLKSPLVASWLAEHPKHLALAGEDLTKLNWLERQFRNVKNQFKAGAATNELEDIGTKAMLGTETKADRKRQAELEQKMGLYSVSAEELGLTGGLNEVPGAVAQQLPIFAKTAAAGALGAVIGGVVAKGPGAKAGWRIASGVEAGRMEASLAYLDFERLKDDRGQPLSRNVALGASIVTGVINGAFEMMGFENLAENTPGLRALTKDGIKKALTKATTGRALRSYLEHVGESATTEGFTEFMQELVTSSAGEYAKMVQDGSISTLSAGELVGRLFSADHLAAAFESGKQGAFAGGGMTSITAGASVPMDVAKAKRAQAAHSVMNDLSTTVKASAMMERMPGKMQEVVEHLAADGPVENLYAPIGVWNEYWQSQKLDPEKVATEVLGPNGAALYQEAEQTGGDIAIPTGVYAAKLAATDHHGGLIAKLRSGPNELSAEEAQEAVKAMDAESEAIQQEAHTERQAEIEDVMSEIQTQLQATGYDEHTSSTLAQMYRHIFNMTSESPKATFEKFGLNISRPALEEAKARQDERVLNQSAWDRVKDLVNDWHPSFNLVTERKASRRVAFPKVMGDLFDLWDRFQDDRIKVMVGDDMLRAFRGGTTRAMSFLRTIDPDEALTERQIEAIVMNEPWVLAAETLKRVKGKNIDERETAVMWALRSMGGELQHRVPEKYHERIKSVVDNAWTEASAMLRGVDEHGVLPAAEEDLDRDVNRSMGREFYQDKLPDGMPPLDADVPKAVLDDIEDWVSHNAVTDEEQDFGNDVYTASESGKWGPIEEVLGHYIKAGKGHLNRKLFAESKKLKRWHDSFELPAFSENTITQLLKGFHSKAERTIEQKMGGKASVSEVRALLKDVKDEEKRWTGINEFLDSLPPDAKVTKDQVLAALQAGRLNIKEVNRKLGSEGMTDDELVEVASDNERERHRSFAREIAAHAVLEQDAQGNWRVAEFDDIPFDADFIGAWDIIGKHIEKYYTGEDGIIIPANEHATHREALDVLQTEIRDDWLMTDAYIGQTDELAEAITAYQDHTADMAMEYATGEFDGEYGGHEEGYSQYTLPGGDNYREILITIPNIHPEFYSSHFDEPGAENIVVHFRLNDRLDENGGRMLFVEEIQSDWHQKGREWGYRDEKTIAATQKRINDLIERKSILFNKLDDLIQQLGPGAADDTPEGKDIDAELNKNQAEIDALQEQLSNRIGSHRAVPDAPFKTTWHELAIKRIMRMAAEGGYDSIGWTTGDQQAERYSLSKVVDEIAWEKEMQLNYGTPEGKWANLVANEFIFSNDGRFYVTGQSPVYVRHLADDDTERFFRIDTHYADRPVEISAESFVRDEGSRRLTELREFSPPINPDVSEAKPTGNIRLKGNKIGNGDGTLRVDAKDDTGQRNTIFQRIVSPDDLHDLVGKEMAAKIKERNASGDIGGEFSGDELKVGGHGMREFYDRVVPSFLRKFTRKYNTTIGMAPVTTHSLEKGVPDYEDDGTIERTPGGFGKVVHHMPLTPELKRAALDDEFVLYQDWQHRSVRAKWAGNVNEINGTQMKWLPLLEFMNDYGLDPDHLEDIELIINKNPRPREGKYRTTIMLKSRKVDADLWRQMIKDAENDPTGHLVTKLATAPMVETNTPIGHIAHDDPKEMERFVADLQFKPTEYRQSRSEIVREARNQIVQFTNDTISQVEGLRYRIEETQKDFVRKHFGDTVAEDTDIQNGRIEYGWAVDSDDEGNVLVVTKIFGMGTLSSIARPGSSDVEHHFQSVEDEENENTDNDLYEVSSMPDTDRRDIHGLQIVKEIRDSINRGKPSDVKRLLVKLDMVNEVMRTAMREEAPTVEKWANMPDSMDQNTDDEPRGRIRIGASSIDIELLKNADLSTFIHESAHFFLEVMSELAPDNEAVAKDLGVIKNWLGMQPDESFGRDQHELFARGFEKYIGEGKAPVPELQTAFARFKAWLSMTYRTLADLNVELTDEVRGVFDRLLASEQEIEKARKEQFQQPLFADPAAVGMSKEEAKSYGEDVQRAKLAAEESLTAQIMQEFEREKSRVWNAEKIKVRAEVGQEANEDLTLRTFSLLRTGLLPNGDELEGFQPFKLDKSDVQTQFKVDVPEGLLATTGGKTRTMSPANAAAYFGFSSPEAMLDALSNTPEPKNWIEKKTNERMRSRRYEGTPLKQMEIEVEAKRAVHNEQRAKLMQRELQVLAAQNLPTLKGLIRRMSRRLPKLAEVTAEAKRIVESKQIKDIRPDVYLRAEAEYAKKAMEAMLKGDINLAFEHKQRELLNHELYVKAADARKAVTNGVKFMNKFNKDKLRRVLGKAGGQYLAQIDALMDRFDFRQGVSNRQVEKKQSLREFLDEQSSLGLQPNVPPEVMNEAYRKHYKELTFEEFTGVVESAKLIQHLAGLKNRLLASGRAKTIGKAVTEMTTKMAENFDITKEEPIELAAGLRTRVKRGVKGLLAAHTKMEFLFEWLDGNTNHGPVWGYLFEPFARAESDENARMKVAAKGIRSIFEVYPKRERATWFWRKTRIAAVDMEFTKGNALSVALNWGNEGNRQALMEGYGWSEKQVEAVLDTLDARDWATVQKVWDYLEGFWPDIEKLEKDLNGIAPEKVEATPIVNKHGSFRGGYYPIVFDEQLSWKQALLNQQEDVTRLFGGNWAQVMTKHGHTQQRTGSGGKPIKLNLTALTQHVTNVVHDLTHRRAVIDVTRLSQMPEIRQAIENAAGRDMYKQIYPWIVNIARGHQTEFYNPIEDLLSRGRVGATVVNMGWKASTAVVQILSYTNTVKEIGAKYSALGVSDVWSKPWKLRESWDFITSRSPFMEHRIANYDRDVRDALQTMNVAGVKSGPLSFLGAYTGPIRNSFFQFIGMMDMAVSMPTWMGAYRKAMDGEAVGIVKGNEDAAIQYADKIVRETQGVGAAKDMAAVQRGSEAYKIFAMFYSYFSVLFNQFAKTQHQLSLDKNLPKYIASIAMLWFVPAALQELMVGRGPDDDDDDSWLKWLSKTEAKYPFQSIIILRDIINGMDRFGYEPSAALDMFGSISDALKASGKVFTEEEITRAEAKNAAMVAGYVTQLPSRQLWLTSEYLFDWLTGTEEPENPIEAGWRGVITGGKKK